MNIREALSVVHSLALYNCLHDDHDGEETLILESKRQDRAIEIVGDLLTGQMEVDNYGQLVLYTDMMEGPNGTVVPFVDNEED